MSMRLILHSFAAAGLFLAAVAFADSAPSPAAARSAPAPAAAAMPLYAGLGNVHHPVTTASPLAQKYFDQGLAFAYGFNHDEARRSFEQAARIDPNMAMAYWGVAWVLGPNYNSPGDVKASRAAASAIARARALEPAASQEERGLIEAMTTRYAQPDEIAQSTAFADAMRAVAHRYPGDFDAQAIFAESLMDLHPWQLWTAGGKPGPETAEIVTTLETVLKQDPNHLGANHYYIHATEASRDPGRATPSAERLGALAPTLGHLVHMPSHIYIHTGRYHDAALANEKAVAVDQAFIAESHETGMYPLMYLTHNIQFLCYAQMMEGRRDDALKSARQLAAHVPLAEVRAMPMAEFMAPMPYFAEARFGQWETILKEPAPPAGMLYTIAIWHYARGLALSAKGDLAGAVVERQALDKAVGAISSGQMFDPGNSARDVALIGAAILDGQIAALRGDHAGAIAKLRDAVHRQDALPYSEPPIWYFPVRESLGAELLAFGRPRDAEAVYREDLRMNPRNPRSLFGHAEALRAEGRSADAAMAQAQFREAWRYADVPLTNPAVAGGAPLHR